MAHYTIGASIIRIGLGGVYYYYYYYYYTIDTIMNPQNPILIIEAATVTP